jgi:hypothetical protein
MIEMHGTQENYILTPTAVLPVVSLVLDQRACINNINLLQPTSYLTHQQFNIQKLYALPTLYLRVLYLSENKQ